MTTFQKIVSVLLAFGIVVGGAGLYHISKSVENMQYLSHNDYGGYDDFDENYLAIRMAEELAQQPTDLFSRLKHELRAPDANAFQVMLAVTASPKEYKNNTTAQLVCGNETAQMEFAAGKFTGEIAVPLGVGELEYLVLLETDGIIRSQLAAMDLWGFANGAEVFGWNETSSSSYYLQHQLDIALNIDETLLPFGDQLGSARVYAKKIDSEKELFSEKMSGNVLQLNQTVPMAEGEEITVYGEVLGKSGMTYIYPIYRFWCYGDSVEGDGYPGENLRIVGANGQEMEAELNY